MFAAGKFADSLKLPLATSTSPSRGPLTRQEAQILSDKLGDDSQMLIYSSLLSIADALRGLDQKFTTWSIVKLYYSCFYSIRAILALSDICIFYSASKGLWLETAVGKLPLKAPNKARGSTHKTAFMIFEQQFPNSPLLSQTIDNVSPFEWLISRREDANYNIARFVEPAENRYFRFVEKSGVRKVCLEYLRDDSFAFDQDHAMLAYPLFLLKHIQQSGVRGVSCLASKEENEAYEAFFADRFGPLRAILEIKKSVLL